MVWTQFAAFVDAIPGQAYVDEDAWGMHKSWDDIMFDAGSAWRLYQRAQHPELGFLLLGDSKLRADPTVVHSFGLLSAAGPQEAQVRALTVGLRWQAHIRHTPMPPMQKGSVLSDRNWSALLNDALILGGVHRGREFHFVATEPMHHPAFKPAGVAGERAQVDMRARALQRDAADLSHAAWEVQVWRDYFLQQLGLLWDTRAHIPRVLAREIIGLRAFGYRPQLLAHQLSFQPPEHVHGMADFVQYRHALHEAGYYVPHKSDGLLATLSHYLFGQARALTALR
jgi:hypothetical protein